MDIKIGDVVFTDGSSGLLGDVVRVDADADEVEVCWRKTFSTEIEDDLIVDEAATLVAHNPPTMVGITESSEVLAGLEKAFSYRSVQNLQRADRGRKLIASHPDFGKMTDSARDELLTAASDTVADILHALNEAGCFDNEHGAAALCGRALRGYEGDFEDEIGV